MAAGSIFKGETGDPNEYVHIWVYENAGTERLKELNYVTDEKWLAYLKKSADLGAIESQINKLGSHSSVLWEAKHSVEG